MITNAHRYRFPANGIDQDILSTEPTAGEISIPEYQKAIPRAGA